MLKPEDITYDAGVIQAKADASKRFTFKELAEKLHATGGTIVANFANSLVWQFSGNNSYTPFTVLDFSLVQPLLRGAGRDRIMEQLTLIERNLRGRVAGGRRIV